MAIPDRTTAADYHYHVYSYQGAKPFALSPAQAQRGDLRFYSMLADLGGLVTAGQGVVPNLRLALTGGLTTGDRVTAVLSFGGGDNPAAAPGVLLTGGIHAREWIAPEITYLVAEYLIKNYRADPVGRYETAIHDLVDARRIYVVPIVNPDGNAYSVFSTDEGARLWRKNRRRLPETAAGWVKALTTFASSNPPFSDVKDLNPAEDAVSYSVPAYGETWRSTQKIVPGVVYGVDLNRNFSTKSFGYATEDNADPAALDYFGPAAASETETQNIEALMDAVDAFAKVYPSIETSIDYHSYGQWIQYPSEAYDSGGVGPGYTAMGRLLQVLIATGVGVHDPPDYKLGTALTLNYFAMVGTLADYAATLHGARAFTIELDPRARDPGFALPEDKIMGVFEKNIRGALALIAGARGQSGPPPPDLFYPHAVLRWEVFEYLNWDVLGRGNRLPV